ncbi:MAG: hypothetical protein PWP45_639 [Tepidanaerobacteraceae bacterium]|nr:hypothetical protein [Tepidanaerobacteraceae bacterium]
MTLREAVTHFSQTKDPAILEKIRKKYGSYGFSLACKIAGIKRREGKRMLGIYDNTKTIRWLANKLCGIKTLKWQ